MNVGPVDGRTGEEAPEPLSGQSEHRFALVFPIPWAGSDAPGTQDEPKKVLSNLA